MPKSLVVFVLFSLVAQSIFFARPAGASRGPAATTHAFYYQVLSFKKSAAEISDNDQEALQALFASLKEKKQKIEQVHVAVWSDKAFSTKTALSQKDRSLADQRAAAVENLLEVKFGIGNVESYSMAQKANWFARAYDLNENDIKALFAGKGAPGNVAPEDFQMIKTKGGPSKAVLIFELET